MVRAAALLVLFAGSLSAAPMTLDVDKDSKGGPCSASYPRTENDAAHPCTLGQAGIGANTPGDTVLVRSSAHPYSDVQTCWDAASGMGCGGWAVLACRGHDRPSSNTTRIVRLCLNASA
jgi:hypothetical protein